MREKRHLSPWRELGLEPGVTSRVRHARDYTLLWCAPGLCSWMLLAVFGGSGIWNSAVPQWSHWWSPVLGGLLTILYGVAGWGIGRRDPRAAGLALALFGWRVLAGALAGDLVSVNTVIGLLGIGLVLSAAQPLGLRSPRPVA